MHQLYPSTLNNRNIVIVPDTPTVIDKVDITLPRSTFVYGSPIENRVSNMPHVASINLTYSQPTLSVYENLNADPKIHRRLSKYFRYKLLDDWLKDDLKYLLKYLKITNNSVGIVEKQTDISDNESDIKKKIRYIENDIFSLDDAIKILKKLVRGTNINWYDLPNKDTYVMRAFEVALKRKVTNN